MQAQDLLQHVQQTISERTTQAKYAANDAAAAAASKAGKVKDAAGSKAGEYLDAAKRRTLPDPTISQRFWSVVTFKPLEQIQVRS